MKRKAFIFLADMIELEKLETLTICGSYKIHRAGKLQAETIRSYVDKRADVFYLGHNRYEQRFTQEPAVELKNGKSRYWVITHDQKQMEQIFRTSLNLSSLDLTVLFEGIYMNSAQSAIIERTQASLTYFEDHKFDLGSVKNLSIKSALEISTIYQALQRFQKTQTEFDFILKALEDFKNLSDISISSPFRTLGYFSILELLFTSRSKGRHHSPISGQLSSKLNLINNMSELKISHQDYFKGSETNTFELYIEKLYSYRSDIAHGSPSDFEKELKVLSTHIENIPAFLRTVVKMSLLEGVKNPQMFKDLREC